MKAKLFFFVGALLMLVPVQGAAQSKPLGTSGRYMTNDSYFLDVKFSGASVTIVEPNKTTTYQKKNDREYLHTDENEKTFGIRVIDAKTLEAFRVDVKQAPTKLTLMPTRRADDEDGEASPTGDEKYNEIAQKYLKLAQTDSIDAQSWSACGAVAMQRALLSKEDADVYAVQAARTLKLMHAEATPCADVITAKNWADAGDE